MYVIPHMTKAKKKPMPTTTPYPTPTGSVVVEAILYIYRRNWTEEKTKEAVKKKKGGGRHGDDNQLPYVEHADCST